MSTLETGAPRAWKSHSLFARLSQVVFVVNELFDVFHEAQRMAREAERRYPFTSF
jgi:hypothetical protein